MELTQILLFAVVGILTILLVAVGVQVMIILFQAQKAVKKIDKIIEDAGVISSSVARPVAGVANFLEGLKSMKNIVELVTGKSSRSSRSADSGLAQSSSGQALPQSQTPTAMQTIQAMIQKSPATPIVEELIEDISSLPQQIQQHSHIHAIQERGRRFFHKGGKPLSS